ncbi:MAG TPA: aldo/keto reductase, partial [Casimicrobiaceae bacterium]|nr:aldo/keto reductase [Casimicrobiaceae bacterium]
MRADPANNRRAFLRTLAGSTALLLAPRSAYADAGPITRVVPSTGEALPVVGLGSWITFNVGDDRAA